MPRYSDPLDISNLTRLNISVLREHIDAGRGVIRRVDSVSAPHLRRAIRAGALEPTGDGGWKLSKKGMFVVAANDNPAPGGTFAGLLSGGARVSFMLKPGREVLDPQNRVVTIVRVEPGDAVVVRLKGPYGATVRLPASTLRPVP